jgi:hypothetical protein
VVELERADALCRTGDCAGTDEMRWLLGRLLVEKGIDPNRGVGLVDEARAIWNSAGLTEKVKAVDAWRAKH